MKNVILVIILFALAVSIWLAMQKRYREPIAPYDPPVTTPQPAAPQTVIPEERRKTVERHYKNLQKQGLRPYNTNEGAGIPEVPSH